MDEEIPEIVAERAEKANRELLPKKSQLLYDREFEKFGNWTNKNSGNEIVLLMGYFHELSESSSPSSLWSKYSMLKSTLLVHRKIDIGNYNRLEAFLKQLSKGYRSGAEGK